MDTRVIQGSLKRQAAQDILRGWSIALSGGNDPAIFVNAFVEFMKDETPQGAEGRRACAMLVQLMDTREWPEMKRLIVPSLPDDSRPVFDLPNAAEFYDTFRDLACGFVRDHWDMHMEEQQARHKAASVEGYLRMCRRVGVLARFLEDINDLEPKKQCKFCKKKVAPHEMAIIAVSRGDNWEVKDATWCGTCSESRAEGLVDDDWEPKVPYSERRPYRHRLSDGFKILAECGGFG